jgi:hypothetical protein
VPSSTTYDEVIEDDDLQDFIEEMDEREKFEIL